MNITKEKFINIMNNIQKHFEYEEKTHKAFSIILKNDYVSNFDSSLLYDSLIDLLKDLTNDTSDIISYYIFEINFGKKFHIGCIKQDGFDVYIRNADELYDYLNKKYHYVETNNH